MTLSSGLVVTSAALLAAAVMDGSRVSAECVAFSPCDALRRSSFVFVADVVEAGSPSERISETQSRAAPQPVRFKIVERLKGIKADEADVSAKIASSSAESVFVTAGIRYLVYASRRPDGTWDTACLGTKPVAEAATDLAKLRQCRVR
jgi:hypothetical protein